jgi:5-formyltetrahydrofolate cyclo-ligase
MKSGQSKEKVRKLLVGKRLQLEAALARQWSEWVQKHFLGSQCYTAARCIGFYAAFDNEVDTRLAFEQSLSDGKIPAFPKITHPGEMIFLREKNFAKMRPNQWGILEPVSDGAPMGVEELDLVVVPGVAFDKTGRRIGFGGGFYDRLLSRIEPRTMAVGFAYSFQVLEKLPAAEHDRRVSRIVTEQGFLKMRL